MTELDYRGEIAANVPVRRRGRLVGFGAVLLVLLLLAGAVGLRWYFSLPRRSANVRPVEFELRLAETVPGPELTMASVADRSPARSVYLHPQAVVSNAHVESAEAVEQQGQYVVQLTFDPVGTTQMLEATAGHRGKPLAVVIDGRVRAVPTVNSQIGQNAVIEANFSEEEARRIAEGIPTR